MKLIDYINGQKRGREAHRLEREAMSDPLLSEALEGFDAVGGDHSERLARMRTKVRQQVYTRSGDHPSKLSLKWRLSVAAGILLILTVGSYWFLKPLADQPNLAEEYDSSSSKEELIMGDHPTLQHPSLQESDPTMNKMAPPPPDAALSERTIAVTSDILRVVKNDAKIQSDFQVEQEEISNYEADTKMQQAPKVATPDRPAEQEGNRLDLPASVPSGYSASHRVQVESSQQKQVDEMAADKVVAVKKESASGYRKARPVAGMKAYKRYLRENLKAPQSEACQGVHGEVVVQFSIDLSGRPTECKVIQSLCEECDREAVRLILDGPDWEVVPSLQQLSISF